MVVYKTIKTLSYIEFMLNDKKQASQFILKIFELAGLFVSLGVPLNKIRLNGKMENYPVIPTDQYLTSRTQNTPALAYIRVYRDNSGCKNTPYGNGTWRKAGA